MQEDADGGGVVVGPGAPGHGVVMRDEEQHAVARADLDAQVLAAPLEGREPLARDRRAAALEEVGDGRLALGVGPADDEPHERQRRVRAADLLDRGDRRDRAPPPRLSARRSPLLILPRG